jgi:DNA polymerase-4
LAAKNLQWLMDTFGPRTGAWMFEVSHGLDDRPIALESEPVSISRETSFERDLHAVRDKAELGAIFTRLCEQLADDLQRKGYVGKTIGIKLKYEDFTAVTRDITIERHIDDAKEIRRVAGLCLKRAPLQKKLRLLGVRMGALLSAEEALALNFKPNKALAHMDTAQAAINSGAEDTLTGQLF